MNSPSCCPPWPHDPERPDPLRRSRPSNSYTRSRGHDPSAGDSCRPVLPTTTKRRSSCARSWPGVPARPLLAYIHGRDTPSWLRLPYVSPYRCEPRGAAAFQPQSLYGLVTPLRQLATIMRDHRLPVGDRSDSLHHGGSGRRAGGVRSSTAPRGGAILDLWQYRAGHIGVGVPRASRVCTLPKTGRSSSRGPWRSIPARWPRASKRRPVLTESGREGTPYPAIPDRSGGA
jgi:hypothetical protein